MPRGLSIILGHPAVFHVQSALVRSALTRQALPHPMTLYFGLMLLFLLFQKNHQPVFVSNKSHSFLLEKVWKPGHENLLRGVFDLWKEMNLSFCTFVNM